MDKIPVIELFEYNVLMSLMDFFSTNLEDKKVHGKNIAVVQSYSDRHMKYISPSLTIEMLYRKNRSIGFGNFIKEEFRENSIIDFEGVLMEYRVQLNVYSNTRGENHKWCSILDDVLKNGEFGIPLNTYLDNGNIKQKEVGKITYDYSSDIKNNNLAPSIVTYDFHTIYEVKMFAIQLYQILYEYAELGNIIGEIK